MAAQASSEANGTGPETPSSIFAARHRLIQEGDIVLVYHARDNIVAIKVTAGRMVPSRFGHFSQSDMIGVPYGSKFTTKTGKGFTYLLRPTPELWTLALPHRTQILYLPDIASITSQLDIGPGSTVIEAGTGSGSFSHAIARAVGAKGQILSFEFHEDRFKKAREEFRSHGLLAPEGSPITIQHRDIVKDGFGEVSAVDAVFLDVPAPWDALDAAKAVMNRKRLSRICCFSPCIEQVQRTVASLTSLGFSDIVMYEALVRNHEAASVPMRTIDDVVSRISEVEVRKEARRERQIREAKRKRLEKEAETPAETETEVEAVESEGAKRKVDVNGDGDEARGSSPVKRIRLDDDTHTDDTPAEGQPSDGPHSAAPISGPAEATPQAPNGRQAVKKAPRESDDVLKTSRPVDMSRGHTSFLTFATLLPDILESIQGITTDVEETIADKPTTPPGSPMAVDAKEAV